MNYSLCGSTFFYLLLSLRNGGIDSRNPSQQACFRAFIDVMDSKAVSMYSEKADLEGLKPHASHLKNANMDGKTNVYMHFGDALLADEFEEKLRDNTSEVFDKIEDYFIKYTGDSEFRRKWIVKQLLGLIDADDSIGKRKFVVNSNLVQSYKEELLNVKEINFYEFMTSIWLYVYRYNADVSVGKETIEEWSKLKGHENADLMNVGSKYDSIIINFDRIDKREKEQNEQEVLQEATCGTELHPEYLLNAFVEKLVELRGGKLQHYITRVKEDYEECYTFRYRLKVPFYDVYVCSDISKRNTSPITYYGYEEERRVSGTRISNIQFNQFDDNCIAILGSGGYGKSMLMRHLLLSCLETEKELVPIFVLLGKFKAESEDGLMDLIYDEMNTLGAGIPSEKITLEEISGLFATGHAVLFLDGFDEIPKAYREKFVDALNKLTRRFNKARFVISSRNNPHIERIDGFRKYDILPLTEPQAKEMINKLVWATDELKNNIISDIESNRFKFTYNEKEKFLGNPLFLTIVVATYQYTHSIQTKRYLFYDDTYRVMYKEHDGLKGITRPYDTGLDEDDFKMMFGEFCALAFSEGETKFEIDVFEDFFQQVINLNNLDIPVSAFASDITDKLCLMYLEGKVYHWVHRSFQEYLAAYFFTQQVDSRFEKIVDVFIERDEDLHEDETLSMMFGLNQAKTEQNIIVSYLRRVVIGHYEQYDADETMYMEAYHDFIEEFYPKVTFYTGDVSNDSTCSDHAIYNFIVDCYGLKVDMSEEDFPGIDLDEDYSKHKIYTRDTGTKTAKGYSLVENVDFEELTEKQQFDIMEYGETDGAWYAGAEIEMDFHYLFDTGRHYNKELLRCIDAPEFSLRREFDGVIKLAKELKAKYEKKSRGSFLSGFH